MKTTRPNYGVGIAFVILLIWVVTLSYSIVFHTINWTNPLNYLLVLAIMHLYTGLFITAHDAMHGSISSAKWLNNLLGWICTFLYAFFPLHNLRKKHFLHHKEVGEERDPDVYHKPFLLWYFTFIKNYFRWWQLLIYAVTFNVLKLWINEANLILFWIIPSLLSTLQLFYFGTYLPHRNTPNNKHKSATLSKNHLIAFLSCYFFGYHYEHHESPQVPWWMLWKTK
ncbi:MAG: beta-carotene ketolase (CrtW type) [Sphingobacteriales bacterium]|jgi:beta-carotene ketolase (CrtW type)